MPERYRLRGDGFRYLNISFGRRGYVARFEVKDDEVVVTRIWHGLEDRPATD